MSDTLDEKDVKEIIAKQLSFKHWNDSNLSYRLLASSNFFGGIEK